MAPGHTPQAPDTITPIGPLGTRPHRMWRGRAPGNADVSSASLGRPLTANRENQSAAPPQSPRVADPGRGAERLSERLLSRQTRGSRGAAELAEKIQSSSLRALRASA